MTSVFVLVDALGWELVKDRNILRDILPHQQEVRTVFGFSSGAIPTILSGMLPREHGHWNLFLFDPKNSPFWFAKPFRALPSSWINNRYVRKVVSVIGRKLSRTQGYFQTYGVPVEILPMFDVCEKDDIYEPGGLKPAPSIFDYLEKGHVPYKAYSYHQYKDQQIVDQAIRDIQSRAASFYFVYLCELDEFLHYNIHDKPRVEEKLTHYATQIRRIFDAAAAVDPDTTFFVTSDHGMTQVTETFDLMGAVESAGLKVPEDYLALYDSTMARFWFFNENARQQIIAKLNSLDCGAIVSATEQKDFGIDFEHNRFGDLIFMMNEGCLMHPSHMGRVPWKGMHGFHPNAISSSAVLLARQRPAVPVEQVRDLFYLMKHEAGIA